jgi:hypothetical protein
MGINIQVIDTRVSERFCVPEGQKVSRNEFAVNASTPLLDCLRKIKQTAGNDKIDRLTILAHAFGWLANQTADAKIHGGLGIEFCKENITIESARHFKELHGLFANQDLGIAIMGCAAADSRPFKLKNGTSAKGNGFELCKSIARWADTGVMASEDGQDVGIETKVYKMRSGWEVKEVSESCADPGAWEGRVWIFRPNGKVEKASPK